MEFQSNDYEFSISVYCVLIGFQKMNQYVIVINILIDKYRRNASIGLELLGLLSMFI